MFGNIFLKYFEKFKGEIKKIKVWYILSMKNISFNMSKFWKIFLIILSILVVAILGSVFVNLGMDWFMLTVKPTQWIPNIIIPIVWSVIYILFGLVLSYWVSRGYLSLKTILLLILNGLLNILWCLVFFALNLTFVGNIVIILNLIASIVLWLDIYKYNKNYAYFVAIYPIWLSIATTLNLAIWILN